MQPFVASGTIVDVALVVDIQSLDKEGQGAALCLIDIALAELFAHFEKLNGGGVLAYQQAAQVVAHARDEVLGFETFVDDIVHQKKNIARITLQEVIDNPEVIVVVEHVEVFDDGLVSDVLPRKTHHLVED